MKLVGEGADMIREQINRSGAENLVQRFEASSIAKEREAIIKAASGASSNELISLLQRALNDKDRCVRYAAAEQSGSTQIKELVIPLTKILAADPDYMVRTSAAESLGMIGDLQGLYSLLKALHDRNALVRGWAAVALSKFPAAEAMEPLKQCVAEDRSHFFKFCAMASLISLGTSEFLPPLILELRSKNYRVRCSAATALGEVANIINETDILDALAAQLRRERFLAVKSSIYAAIAAIATVEKMAVRMLEEFLKLTPMTIC